MTSSATRPPPSCTAPTTAQQLRLLLERAVARKDLSERQLEVITARQLEAGPAILCHHFLWEGQLSDQLCKEIMDEVVLPLLTRSTGKTWTT